MNVRIFKVEAPNMRSPMSDPMIDIWWRYAEMFDELFRPAKEAGFEQLKTEIEEANKTGNYSEVIESIKSTIDAAEVIIVNTASHVDVQKIRALIKRLVKAIYDNCPGAQRAVAHDGTIDPSWLPD